MSKPDEYLTIKDAAEHLGVCANTLRNWGASGKIKEADHLEEFLATYSPTWSDNDIWLPRMSFVKEPVMAYSSGRPPEVIVIAHKSRLVHASVHCYDRSWTFFGPPYERVREEILGRGGFVYPNRPGPPKWMSESNVPRSADNAPP